MEGEREGRREEGRKEEKKFRTFRISLFSLYYGFKLAWRGL